MDQFKYYVNEIEQGGDGRITEPAPGKVLVTMYILEAPRFEPSMDMSKEEFMAMCKDVDAREGDFANSFKQLFVSEFARGVYEDGHTDTHKPSEIPDFEEPEFDPEADFDFEAFGF